MNDATDEVDLLVCGAGPGGMAAALSGALHGLNVLVCEKSQQIGGTAATSAGTLWIPGNSQSVAAGFTGDTPEAARRYMDQLIDRPEDGAALRDAYLAHGPAVIDWFGERTRVKFLACGKHPDYLDRDGAAVTGRAIIPQPFDGRLLGRDFRRVRAPIPEFMVLGGMMVGKMDIAHLLARFRSWGSFVYSGKLFARYLADRLRHARGTRLVMGNALVARMYASLRDAHVPVMFGARLDGLHVEGGRVAGAWVVAGGERKLVRARRGVVLATGGFARNGSLRASFMTPPAADSMAVPENQGEGIEAALAVGAFARDEAHGSGAFWAPVSRTGFAPSPHGGSAAQARAKDASSADGKPWSGLFPHLVMDRAKPGLIAVNAAGERFVNEAASYHHFVEAMFASDERVSTVPAWLVCEASFVRKYGLGAIHPGTTDLAPYARKGWVVLDDSLGGLAAQMGVDAQGLARTVARHNGFARGGVDEDFGKGTTELNRFNGDPAHGPNPCIGPIERGPFCAMAVWPAEIACSTGLETDADARVLRPDGSAIEGLYASGNDLASIMRGTYPGPGTTLGPALVFGWLAGRHAAACGEPAVRGESDGKAGVEVAHGGARRHIDALP